MVMQVESSLQYAAVNPIRDVLIECLTDPTYNRFRFSVAFARWSGLYLLDDAIQRFSHRQNTSIIGYVGTDMGGTTVEALTYLSELSQSAIYTVECNMDRIIFHPKVFEFSGPRKWLTVIGSSNLTMGGLLSNVEASIILRGPGKQIPSASIFKKLAPTPPFTADHVRLVDSHLLEEIAPRLDHYTKRSPDAPSGRRAGRPLIAGLVLPNPGRPPSPAGARRSPGQSSRTRRSPITTTARAATTRETLFVEMWDETRDGTQVQLPRKVFTDFFGAAADAVTWIKLHVPGGGHLRVRLQGFPNATFRISLPFVGQAESGDGRRAVIRFDRVGQDEYVCAVIHKGSASYDHWLAACDRQTNVNSKRFGIGPTASAPGPRPVRTS